MHSNLKTLLTILALLVGSALVVGIAFGDERPAIVWVDMLLEPDGSTNICEVLGHPLSNYKHDKNPGCGTEERADPDYRIAPDVVQALINAGTAWEVEIDGKRYLHMQFAGEPLDNTATCWRDNRYPVPLIPCGGESNIPTATLTPTSTLTAKPTTTAEATEAPTAKPTELPLRMISLWYLCKNEYPPKADSYSSCIFWFDWIQNAGVEVSINLPNEPADKPWGGTNWFKPAPGERDFHVQNIGPWNEFDCIYGPVQLSLDGGKTVYMVRDWRQHTPCAK